MKKLLCILLTMAMLFSVTACGSGDSAAPDKKDENAGLIYPYNLVNRPMKVDDVYDYKTICYQDSTVETNGHVYIYDYIVEPAGDGMVDKTVKAIFIFDDDNAWNYGMKFDLLYADFVNDTVYGGEGDWIAQVDGRDYPVTVVKDEFIYSEWTPMGNFVSKYVLTIRMPEGYDNVGLFFYNSAHKNNVRDENGDIPDGTPITSLVDSHSQWFVLGGKGADWEETKTPTYFGQPIEAQVNNIAVEDVLGGVPVFDVEEDYSDEAPPADYFEQELTDSGSEDFENNYTYIEFDDWSHDSYRREMIYETKIQFTAYNTSPGCYAVAKVWIGDRDNPVNEKTVESLYSEGTDAYPSAVIFVTDGTGTAAPSVSFELTLYDEDGNELSVAQMDIPFED